MPTRRCTLRCDYYTAAQSCFSQHVYTRAGPVHRIALWRVTFRDPFSPLSVSTPAKSPSVLSPYKYLFFFPFRLLGPGRCRYTDTAAAVSRADSMKLRFSKSAITSAPLRYFHGNRAVYEALKRF